MKDRIRLDLNNPVFQRQLFELEKEHQLAVLRALRKLSQLIWPALYSDRGFRWEAIVSRKGPAGKRLYTIRLSSGFRAVVHREDAWLRFLTLHPDHDSAY
ncbi:MAG: hypothetical protein ACC742_14710 [Thermoanaerobaculales bacterium]